MRRLIGFALFCTALGMLAGLFIESILVSAIVIFLLLLAGYHMFLC